jgi:hypothetical protein
MNKSDKHGILNLAVMFLREYKRLSNPEDPRENLKACQANYDALTGFRYYKFIQDFDIDRGILLDNVWHKVEVFK